MWFRCFGCVLSIDYLFTTAIIINVGLKTEVKIEVKLEWKLMWKLSWKLRWKLKRELLKMKAHFGNESTFRKWKHISKMKEHFENESTFQNSKHILNCPTRKVTPEVTDEWPLKGLLNLDLFCFLPQT